MEIDKFDEYLDNKHKTEQEELNNGYNENIENNSTGDININSNIGETYREEGQGSEEIIFPGEIHTTPYTYGNFPPADEENINEPKYVEPVNDVSDIDAEPYIAGQPLDYRLAELQSDSTNMLVTEGAVEIEEPVMEDDEIIETEISESEINMGNDFQVDFTDNQDGTYTDRDGLRFQFGDNDSIGEGELYPEREYLASLPAKKKNLIEDIEYINPEYKKIIFGRSDFKNGKDKKENENVLSMLTDISKTGNYIDTYLPMSNLLVRTYEFENDIVKYEFSGDVLENFNQREVLRLNNGISRRFIEKIMKYTEIIASNSRYMERHDLDNLSDKDTSLLLLSVARLLNGENNIKMRFECEKCQSVNLVDVDMDKIIKAQYTPEMIEYMNQNFSVEETIEDNLKRSQHARNLGAKLVNSQIETDKDVHLMVICSDPSYNKARLLEEKIYPDLIKYYERRGLLDEELNNKNYLALPMKSKLGVLSALITEKMSEGAYGAEAVLTELSNDFSKLKYLTYISKIVGFKTPKTGDTTKREIVQDINIMNILRIENSLNEPDKFKKEIDNLWLIFDKLPSDLLKEIDEKIEKIENRAIDDVECDFTCEKCKHEQTVKIPPINFVFFSLQKNLKSIK